MLYLLVTATQAHGVTNMFIYAWTREEDAFISNYMFEYLHSSVELCTKYIRVHFA